MLRLLICGVMLLAVAGCNSRQQDLATTGAKIRQFRNLRDNAKDAWNTCADSVTKAVAARPELKDSAEVYDSPECVKALTMSREREAAEADVRSWCADHLELCEAQQRLEAIMK